MIPNCTRRKNDLVTVPQRFPCRDEAECQKTGLFPALFAEQHCPDAVARAWWLQIHCRPGRVFENWLLKKKSRSSWVDAGGKCQLLLVLLGPRGRKEHSCGSCERTTVSMEYTAHGAFYWGSPVERDIINMWWLKTAPPDSHVVNHVLLMNKHSSSSSPVV